MSLAGLDRLATPYSDFFYSVSLYMLCYGLFYDVTGKDPLILRPWPDQFSHESPLFLCGQFMAEITMI